MQSNSSKKIKILVLASNPTKELNLDSEIRQLREVIGKSRDRDKFEMADALAVEADDLQGLILQHKPNIVHFCGHGSGKQELVFQDENRQPQTVKSEALSGLLKLASDYVRCVVLNACYSADQSAAIVQHIDYVIGMRQQIRDESAIAFAKGFYQALAYGCSIEESYDWGCNAIQFLRDSSKPRKLVSIETDQVNIPEHQKPVLLLKDGVRKSTQSSNVDSIDDETDKIRDSIKNEVLQVNQADLSLWQEPRTQSLQSGSEEIPDFINRLMQDFFSTSALKWSVCFTGEDESVKLEEFTRNLRKEFSGTGNGKNIPSGFSYWGLIATLAWENACRDNLYRVMKNSITTFGSRWKKIPDEEVIDQKYHYVSLGVGTGEKDYTILLRLYTSNNNVRYFPIDMSACMLRLGTHQATSGIGLRGSNVLPIQIDFSTRSNISELRSLLDQLDSNEPILFSLLGNTLANFKDDKGLLKNILSLMKNGDKLLLEIATTERLDKDVAEAAADEYSSSRSFCKFATSSLFEYTNLDIEGSGKIEYEASIEEDKALLIKVLYRNTTKETVTVMLPDRENVDFEPGDTIRLFTTRKYTLAGIRRVIESLIIEYESTPSSKLEIVCLSPPDALDDNGFGMALFLLLKKTILVK